MPRPDTLPAFHGHPVPTLVLDDQGLIVAANHAAEQLLNRPNAALIGKSVQHVIPWYGDHGLSSLLSEPGKSLSAYDVELSISGLIADITIGPASTETGARIVAIHPIPRAGHALHRSPGSAARSAGAAAAMLAHEIKNPLSGIRGAAQLMGKAHPGNDNAALADLIVGEVDRIAKLIDSMQGFTRGAPLTCQPLNIYPAIAQARSIAAQGFADPVRFAEEFDPSLPQVMGNHDAIVQILLNLIKNGYEATSAAPQPMLRLATAYRHGLSWDCGDGRGQLALPVEISVADNGPGIAAELIDVLFDPFVTSKADGQGLGLALVEKLAREMGGFVAHDRLDGWTCFRLHLPFARQSAVKAI